MTTRLLTKPEVLDRLRISYPTLHRWVQTGRFPKPIGYRKLLWSEKQVNDWIDRVPPDGEPVSTLVATLTERKKKKKAFDQRQEAAAAKLLQHATNR